jgi:hypothetical protein
MFSRSHEITDIFNAIRASGNVKGGSVPRIHDDTVLSNLPNVKKRDITLAKSILEGTQSSAYSLSGITNSSQNVGSRNFFTIAYHGQEMDCAKFPKSWGKAEGINSFLPGFNWNGFMNVGGTEGSGAFTSDNIDPVVIFSGLVGQPGAIAISNTTLFFTEEQRSVLANAIDTVIDHYASVFTMSDVFLPDEPIPKDLSSPISHDCPCFVNLSDQESHVLMHVTYEDDSIKPVKYGWVVEPHGSLHARLDLIFHKKEEGSELEPAILRNKPCSVVGFTDNPSLALTGTGSRAWFNNDDPRGIAALMSSSLPSVGTIPPSYRMPQTVLEDNVKESHELFDYR